MKNRRRSSSPSIIFLLLLGVFTVLIDVVQTASVIAQSSQDTITLKIEGWTCASCEKGIRRSLLAVSGVKSADVSYARGGAVVVVETGRVTTDQLVQAVASAGNILSSYRAIVVPNGTLGAGVGEHDAGSSWFWNLFR